MLWLYVALGVLVGAIIITLITSLVCFFMVFYSPKRVELGEGEYDIPPGEIYLPYRERMIGWMKDGREAKYEECEITSHDGLTLRGKYYEHKKGAPLEIMLHGYRGNAERDLCGGVYRCERLGRNALIVNHRAAGNSDGHIISFGINERRDLLRWIDFANEKFGTDTKIILTGISMGAATVMMAAGEKLPDNVICALADCGYTSPKEIIKKVMRDMRLPATLFYPFIKLGARLFGRFNLEEASPIEAVKRASVPIIFVHGDTDDFVPYSMAEELYAACTSKKKLITAKGAGHGLAFPADEEGYLRAVSEFSSEIGI